MVCQGAGFRTSQQPQTVHDAAGNPVTQMVNVTTPCTCAAGRVTCTQCGGNGRKTCASCNGSGRTKSFDQLSIRFRHASDKEVIGAAYVPEHYLQAARGEVVLDQSAFHDVPAVASDADPRIGELVRKSRTVDERSTRLLFQHLHVERVPIHEIVYRYAGDTKRLWIYGCEQEVYAPGAPWHWKQALGIVAGVIGVVVTLIVIAVLLAH